MKINNDKGPADTLLPMMIMKSDNIEKVPSEKQIGSNDEMPVGSTSRRCENVVALFTSATTGSLRISFHPAITGIIQK